MPTERKPGSVLTALILLVLIAVYQFVYGGLLLLSLVLRQSTDLLEQFPTAHSGTELPFWAPMNAGIIALLYAAAAVVLIVMVARASERARTAVLWVNAVYGVLILALVFSPLAGVLDLVSALFAFTVVALMQSANAKRHFGAVPQPA